MRFRLGFETWPDYRTEFRPAAAGPFISGIRRIHRARHDKQIRRHQRGFTLIEVLMAVFVLAVALTGMMRLHLTALRAQRQSSTQTVAAHLAGDMAEIIHAWAAPGNDAPFLFDYRAGDAPPPQPTDCNGGVRCDPAALRRFGVAQWLETVNAALPMARVSVCRDAMPWDRTGGFLWACSGGAADIVIKIGWRAEAGNNGDGNPAANGPQLVLDIGAPK